MQTATIEEAEWAYQRAISGFADDWIRENILGADSADEAIAFVRSHKNGGGCGPAGGPSGEQYWYDYERDGIHAWFGPHSGKPADGDFAKGQRYVHLTWTSVVRRCRTELAASQPSLF